MRKLLNYGRQDIHDFHYTAGTSQHCVFVFVNKYHWKRYVSIFTRLYVVRSYAHFLLEIIEVKSANEVAYKHLLAT